MARREIGRMRSVFAQLPVFQTDDEQTNMNRAVHVAGILDTIKTAQTRYKASVLAHPDLAEQLRRAMHLQRADQWTGYIPPATEASNGHPSSSPYRAVIVAIVTEALKRSEAWEPGDRVRLATVSEHLIKAPWKEHHYAARQKAQEERIAGLLNEDADE